MHLKTMSPENCPMKVVLLFLTRLLLMSAEATGQKGAEVTQHRNAGACNQHNIIAGLILEDVKGLISSTEEVKEQVQEGQTRCEATIMEVTNAQNQHLQALKQEILQRFNTLAQKIEQQNERMDNIEDKVAPKNCFDVVNAISGAYRLSIAGESVNVFCDMETSGGGWTVIQSRKDGSMSFNKTWADYELGFGDLSGEHWLGNKWVHLMTSDTNHQLRIDIEDGNGAKAYAEYSSFKLSSAADKYRLSVGRYSGTAGNGLFSSAAGCETAGTHNGVQFSTPDQDNDDSESTHCGRVHQCGWWFNKCFCANLNGGPQDGNSSWFPWKQTFYSFTISTMKIRPLR